MSRSELREVGYMLILVSTALSSCGRSGPKPPNPKPTIPVHGEVYVDGQPARDVYVELVPADGVDMSNPTSSYGKTRDDGSFDVMTYSTGDGAPAGEYAMTFKWQDLTKGARSPRTGDADDWFPDQLDGRYADPNKSRHTIIVDPDATEVDVGRIHLKTR